MAVVTAKKPAAASGDEPLLRRFRAGDPAALEDLFRRHRDVAYRVAYRLLGNEADALDAVQDGFLKVFLHLQAFEGRCTLKTWVLRVVSNAALDLGRQRGQREGLCEPLQWSDDDAMPLQIDDVGAGINQADLRRLLNGALARLPEAMRQTFVLHVDAEMSYREIAETLGISIGTVMSRLYYARQRLRQYLTPQLVP